MPPKEVLLIEDHFLTQELIKLFLENNGFPVVCVSDGASAIKALQQKIFPVIFIDLGLPDYEELELIQKIKEIPLDYSPVLIGISGQVDEKLHQAAQDAGCVTLLEKPIQALQQVNGHSIVQYLQSLLQYNSPKQ